MGLGRNTSEHVLPTLAISPQGSRGIGPVQASGCLHQPEREVVRWWRQPLSQRPRATLQIWSIISLNNRGPSCTLVPQFCMFLPLRRQKAGSYLVSCFLFDYKSCPQSWANNSSFHHVWLWNRIYKRRMGWISSLFLLERRWKYRCFPFLNGICGNQRKKLFSS